MLTEYKFAFGLDAIVASQRHAQFEDLKAGVLCAVQPGTLLESLVAEELLHAQWELERIRNLGHSEEAEHRLHDAERRASRNWHRARRELTALQSARAAGTPALAPLADSNRVPEPKISRRMSDWVYNKFQKDLAAPSTLACFERAKEEF